MKYFSFDYYFPKPSPRALAVQELEDAQRELLQAQSGKEYSMSIEAYNAARVARLTEYLKDL